MVNNDKIHSNLILLIATTGILGLIAITIFFYKLYIISSSKIVFIYSCIFIAYYSFFFDNIMPIIGLILLISSNQNRLFKMIKKIKIFHIIGSMEIIAGTENFLINLLNENNSRYENYLILLKKKNDLKNRLKKNIKIKTFELDNPISFFVNFTKLIIFLSKKKPKIIYSWLYHANFVLRPIFKR